MSIGLGIGFCVLVLLGAGLVGWPVPLVAYGLVGAGFALALPALPRVWKPLRCIPDRLRQLWLESPLAVILLAALLIEMLVDLLFWVPHLTGTFSTLIFMLPSTGSGPVSTTIPRVSRSVLHREI